MSPWRGLRGVAVLCGARPGEALQVHREALLLRLRRGYAGGHVLRQGRERGENRRPEDKYGERVSDPSTMQCSGKHIKQS